jgi:hypothetical protein
VRTDCFLVPNGLDELKDEMATVVKVIVRTARWVHPDAFRALPVWYPEIARKQPIYDSEWRSVYKNANRITAQVTEKSEPNIRAKKAFVAALGASKTDHWTVCHIWGVDDSRFQRNNSVVCDPKYYSCVANMVWLPTPLKGFTDAVPEIKHMLRICSFYLYGWACEHGDVKKQFEEVTSGSIPAAYPTEWPAKGRHCLPPGTAPFSPRVAAAIKKRKDALRQMLENPALENFPRNQVLDVLRFWKIEL